MIRYYKMFLVETDENDPNRIATAAILRCSFCSNIISGSDGPGTNIMCLECFNKVKNGVFR